MKKLNRTTLFLYCLYLCEVVFLLFIVVVSYEAVESEFVNLLPLQSFPLLVNIADLVFVVMVSAFLWLATDRTVYLLGVMVRAGKEGLKDIEGNPTDFLTYIGQTLLVGSLSAFVFVASYHFTTVGAGLQMERNSPTYAMKSIDEISLKFSEKERNTMKYYDSLRLLEEKKYQRVISLQSIELAQKQMERLETAKENSLQSLRKQQDSEILRAESANKEAKKEAQEKRKNGNMMGGVLELLAILCAVAIQIFSARKLEISQKSHEISQKFAENLQKKEEKPEKEKIDVGEILYYYNEVERGVLKQNEVATLCGVSNSTVSRIYREHKENKVNGKSYNLESANHLFQ